MINCITSYLSRQNLLIVLALTISITVVFFTPHNVQSSTLGISASVAAPPLEAPAIITAPNNKARFNNMTITVSGICPAGSAYVTLTRNNIPAGVTSCSEGQFSLPTSLVEGVNTLIAHAYNITNNPGPIEEATTVYYDLTEQASPPFIQSSLPHILDPITSPYLQCTPTPILLSHEPYFPIQKKKHWQWTITVHKGCPPYTLTITWGDGQVEKHEIQNDTTLTLNHTYDHEGYFKPLFEVVDTAQTSATLQLLVIIDPESIHETKKPKDNNHDATDSSSSLITIVAATGSVIAIAAITLGHHYGRLRKR